MALRHVPREVATRAVLTAAGHHHDDDNQHSDQGNDPNKLHPASRRLRSRVAMAELVIHFHVLFASMGWVKRGGRVRGHHHRQPTP